MHGAGACRGGCKTFLGSAWGYFAGDCMGTMAYTVMVHDI